MLDVTRRGIFEKSRRLGTGPTRIVLDDNDCRKLVAIIARDLGVEEPILALTPDLPDFYSPEFADCDSSGLSGLEAFTALVESVTDGELFFHCLAAIHLRRLKYQHILSTQPMPTLEQVGPRGLLQFGMAPPAHIASLLFWRKWIYDIDNRAAQETGYIFEPIIAMSIGGVPYSAAKSPVKGRRGNGRQVDCLRDNDAYELKLRVTIAASGQGRWDAELDFPEDCRRSGFRPILVVFDSTPNPKLSALMGAFEDAGGLHYVGEHAWNHLEELAGGTMSVFLEKYVRHPLESLLKNAPALAMLPSLSLELTGDQIVVRVGDFDLRIDRAADDFDLVVDDGFAEDATDTLPGL